MVAREDQIEGRQRIEAGERMLGETSDRMVMNDSNEWIYRWAVESSEVVETECETE